MIAAVKNTFVDTILSRQNANAFLQSKTRSRRSLREEVIEECCEETCDYKERSNLAGKDGSWEAFSDVLCEVSSLGRRSCKCKTKEGYMYDCGRREDCADKTCECDENTKDPNWWKVTNVTYDDSRSTLKRSVVTSSSHTADNLPSQIEVTLKFVFSTSLTESESFTFFFHLNFFYSFLII